MLHTIRQLVNDDEKWRGILRGLNATFRHQTVMGSQIEEYISKEAGIDLSKVFDQYLRTTKIPQLEVMPGTSGFNYRWSNVVSGFAMPVRVRFGEGAWITVRPTSSWQSMAVEGSGPFSVDENFYVTKRILEVVGDSF